MYIKENAACPQGFTVVPNSVIRDGRLSLKAKGLFLLLTSLPPDWKFSIAGLVSICRESETGVRSGLKELERTGWLVRQRTRSVAGCFEPVSYYFGNQNLSSRLQNPHVENQRQLKKENRQNKKQPQTRYSVWADDPEVY